MGFQELTATNVMVNNCNVVLTSEQLIKLEGLSVSLKEIQKFEETPDYRAKPHFGINYAGTELQLLL